MQKSILRSLRSLPATKQMMEKAKETVKREDYCGYPPRKRTFIEPRYEQLARVQELSGYIKVAIFLTEWMKKGIRTPRYEVFVDKENGVFITRELDEKGTEKAWRESMVKNLEGVCVRTYWRGWRETPTFISRDGRDTLGRLMLKNDDGEKGLNRLDRWQQEQINRNRMEMERKEQEPWDKDMKLIPKLPDGFEEWMRKEVCRETFIFYTYDRKGAKEGYCSRCKKRVPIKEPRHGKGTKCPSCKKPAIFKADSKIQTLLVNSYDAEILQKIPGGIVIRGYSQSQSYRGKNYESPGIFTREGSRLLIMDDGTVKRYLWTNYKNRFMRWVPDKEYTPYRTYYWSSRIKLYKRNLKTVKKTTKILQRSAAELWEDLPVPLSSYLAIEQGNPAVEMLAKIGMFRMAEEIIRESYNKGLIKQDETELPKMLRVDKARLKRLKEMDAGIGELRWMQMEKMANTIWPDEMIKDLGREGIKTSDFGFLDITIDFRKEWNYVKKQAAIMDDTMTHALVTWRDYLYMAEKMKKNIKLEQIRKPKNVKRAHDELVMLEKQNGIEKQAKTLEKKFKKVNKQLKKLAKFEYEQGDYLIIAPKKVADIVKEGVILGHCVHTCDYYFSRIQDDESYLFFLRKTESPDMPWYTLEVEPSGNIRQKRTTGDKQNKDFEKALPFLKKWQKFFKKQLTKEEQELGVRADRLRKEGYRKLREDGNRVWHGPLAGQLLADVLESDFMEAM